MTMPLTTALIPSSAWLWLGMVVAVRYYFQMAIVRAEEQAVDGDVSGDQRVTADLGHHLGHILCRAAEGAQPLGQVRHDDVNGPGIDAAVGHASLQTVGIHLGHAAVFMADDEYLLDPQHED